MLAKLLRYEFKALLRIMPALYLALLALSVIAGINGRIEAGGKDGNFMVSADSGAGFIYIVWGIMFLALLVVNLVTVVLRYKDNLLRDEGYLMFTLPVPEWTLVVSKAVAALCTLLLSAAACVLALVIFAFIVEYRQALDSLPRMFRWVLDNWAHIDFPSFALKVVIALIVAVQQLCLVYAAMTVSQIAPRFRGLAGFGSYLAVMGFVQQPLTRVIQALSLSGTPRLLALACLEAVFALIYFQAANWLLKHRLNLE